MQVCCRKTLKIGRWIAPALAEPIRFGSAVVSAIGEALEIESGRAHAMVESHGRGCVFLGM